MSHLPPVLNVNHDVLSTVLEHAEANTLLSLMLCCRALYQDGVRVLLAKPARIDTFYRGHQEEDPRRLVFPEIHADGGRRWQSLRGLIDILGGWKLFFRAAGQLAEGIKQAPNIEYLELIYADGLFEAYPGKKVRRPRFARKRQASQARTRWNIHMSVSRERAVAPRHCYTRHLLGSPPPDRNNITKHTQYIGEDPTALLRGAQNTLVRLHCKFWGPLEYRSGNPIHPNVKSLNMTSMYPMTHEWVKAYPNVSQLSISNNDYPIGRGEARVRATHESNIHSLADQCWPSLEQCHSYCVADL